MWILNTDVYKPVDNSVYKIFKRISNAGRVKIAQIFTAYLDAI